MSTEPGSASVSTLAAQQAKRAAVFGRFLLGSEGGLRARVLRSGIWVGVASTSQSLLQTARSIMLARLLSPEAFGLMGLCMIVIRGLDLFTETGFGAALIQRQGEVEHAKNTAFTLQAIRGLGLTIVACAAAPLAATFYDEPRLTTLLWWLALAFTLNGFSNINTVLLEKRLDFRLVTTLELGVAVFSTAVTVVLAWVMRSVWAIAIGHIVMVATRLVLSYALVPGRPVFEIDRKVAGELHRYGRYITGLTIALFLTTEADNLVVGKLLGLEPLGVYTMAYMLANLPATHFSKVASRVLFPAYSAIQGSPEKLRATYLTVLGVVSSVALPAGVGLGVLASEITRIVYGERWLAAAPALRILAVFGAMRAISSLGGYVLQAIGRPEINLILVSAKLVVILVALPLLTSRFGIEGAALAVTVPQVVADIASIGVLARYTSLSVGEVIRVVGRIAIPAAVMGVVVATARQTLGDVHLGSLLALVGLGVATFSLLAFPELKALYTLHLRPALAARRQGTQRRRQGCEEEDQAGTATRAS